MRVLIILFIALTLFFPAIIFAGTTTLKDTGLDITANTAGLNVQKGDIQEITGDVLGWALGILGMVFLLIVMVGGYSWMMAGGDEQKITKAKTMIGAGMSGMIILFLSYVLARAVLEALSIATGTG